MIDDICLVIFPYVEASGYKVRPVVRLSLPRGPHGLVLVGHITSKVEQTLLDSNIVLPATTQTGPLRDSTLRLHKIVAVPEESLKRRLGKLSSPAVKQKHTCLAELFAL